MIAPALGESSRHPKGLCSRMERHSHLAASLFPHVDQRVRIIPCVRPSKSNHSESPMKADSPAAMRSLLHLRVIAPAALLAWVLYATISAQPPAAQRLAGAQAEINARDYPSLQAAIDA